MIVEVILDAIVFVVLGIVGLFPPLPVMRFDFLDDVIGVIGLADMFVSVHVVAVCFGIIMLVLNAHLIWSVIMWIARKIPGVN